MHPRRYLLKLAGFGLAPGLLIGGGIAALVVAGELTPVDRVIELQAGDSVTALYGTAYSHPEKYYKLHAAIRRRPQVLALGTSRIWQLRAEFFNQGVSFYNAGGGTRRPDHFLQFLRAIPTVHQPRVVIVELHHDMFASVHDSLPDDVEAAYSAAPSARTLAGGSWRQALFDLAGGKYDVGSLRRDDDGIRRIGLRARVNGAGFRNDGSWDYGSRIGDESMRYIYGDEIEAGTEHFHHSADLSATALPALDEFLREAGRRGIEVVGFLPPYDHGTFVKLRSMPDEFGHLRELAPRLEQLFASRGSTFHDFSDPTSFGALDAEFIDELHGSEKVYLRLWLRIVAASSWLAAYSDREALEAALLASESPLTVFAADFPSSGHDPAGGD